MNMKKPADSDTTIHINEDEDYQSGNEESLSFPTYSVLGVEENEIDHIELSNFREWIFQSHGGLVGKKTCSVEANLIQLTTQVLDQYKSIPNIQIETSGYLDLYGCVWGCLLRNNTSWVDMVLVEGDDHNETSFLTIIRFEPSMYFQV